MTSKPRGRGQLFSDDGTKELELKYATMDGIEVSNCPNLRDVIYGLPFLRALSKIILIVKLTRIT